MTFCMVILIGPREFLTDWIAQNKCNLLSLTTLKCKQTIALKLVLSFITIIIITVYCSK